MSYHDQNCEYIQKNETKPLVYSQMFCFFVPFSVFSWFLRGCIGLKPFRGNLNFIFTSFQRGY